mmetsp:Transcript_18955/g.26944  ORF Transcript_18955/g.26944 Transcript_18955/m.26944 type:complete len:123 (-) Transcript_18955:3-371(-)
MHLSILFFLRVERKYNTRTAATATMTLSIKTAVLAPGDLDAVDATFPPVLPSICEECKQLEGLASARAAGLGYEVGGVVGKSVGIVVGGEDKWPLGLIVSFTEEALGETFGDLVPDGQSHIR